MKQTVQSIESRARAFRQHLEARGAPERTRALIPHVRAFTVEAGNTIEAEKNEVRTRYGVDYARWHGVEPPRNAAPDDPSSSRVGAIRAAGVAVVCAEAVFSALLGILTFNAPPAAAALIGSAFSLTICLVTLAVWRVLVVPVARDFPGTAFQTLKKQLKVLAPCWGIALIGALLVGRIMTSSTSAGTTVFLLLLTCLSVLSPMLSAVMACIAHQMNWAGRHAAEFRYLTKVEFLLDSLDHTCNSVERRVGGPPPRAISAAAAASAFVILAMAGKASAADCGNQVWIDATRSVSAVERQQTVDNLLELLPALAQLNCGDEWQLFGFAGGAYSATPFFTIQIPNSPSGACSVPPSPKSSEMGTIFRAPAKADAAERRANCEAAHTEELRKYRAAVQQQADEARETYARFSAGVPRPDHTCIADLFRRLADPRAGVRRAVVITDGSENCDSQHNSIRLPSAPPTVAMVIVSQADPPKSLTPGQYYDMTSLKWGKSAPWVVTMPPFAVTKKDFGAVFGLSAQGAAGANTAQKK